VENLMSLLEVRHLTKRLGDRVVLDDVSLSVDAGGSVRISVFKAGVEIHTDGRTNRSA